jgi:hypothetical protein
MRKHCHDLGWTAIDWLVIASFAGFLFSFLAGWFE